MHETLIKDVKLWVDDIKRTKDSVRIIGWCSSQSKKVLTLRLAVDGKSVGAVTSGGSREDVAKFYESDNFLNSGFEININDPEIKKENDVKLQASIGDEGNWVDVKEFEEEEKIKLSKLDLSVLKINPTLNRDFVVIDNFYENPMDVREFALSTDMKMHEDYHKGNRTDEIYIAKGTKERFEDLLGKEITKWDFGTNGCFQFCTAEDKLVYHTDGQMWAGAVYLTPDAPVQCGTSFFKSKINGWHKEPSEEEAKKLGVDPTAIHSEIFSSGFYDRTNLELVDTVGNVFNRLTLWNAKLIHAASEYFGSDKNNSRLFQLFFFDSK
jgi:hypothetical protein